MDVGRRSRRGGWGWTTGMRQDGAVGKVRAVRGDAPNRRWAQGTRREGGGGGWEASLATGSSLPNAQGHKPYRPRPFLLRLVKCRSRTDSDLPVQLSEPRHMHCRPLTLFLGGLRVEATPPRVSRLPGRGGTLQSRRDVRRHSVRADAYVCGRGRRRQDFRVRGRGA